MKKLNPFNIDLLFATDQVVSRMKPVTTTDIYQGISRNFHPEGLYSTDIFGRVGTTERDNNFSYIKLNAYIIHPNMYGVIKQLKRFYIDILEGKAYAKWNPETNDFESSDVFSGDTGYAFFTSKLKELIPSRSNSKRRDVYIELFEKYKNSCLMNNCLVIPAGMRDVYQTEDGNDKKDEINDIYAKIIIISKNINVVGASMNDPVINPQRVRLQLAMNELYDYILAILEGKRGLIQSKWGGRRIVLGTRNVISSVQTTAEKLGSVRAPHMDDVQIGLYQTISGALPITIHCLKTKFLDQIFDPMNREQTAYLINPRTKQLEEVYMANRSWDKWVSMKGLESLVQGFEDENVRARPVMIDGHYLAYIWKDNETFKVVRDINTLPDPDMEKDLKPMTYAEMYYIAGYERFYQLRALCTRYPINNVYSIYPAKIYTKNTTTSKGLHELGDDWTTRIGFAREYPFPDEQGYYNWVNTAIISFTRLDNLNADYDGDMISVNILYSNEAIEEINRNLGSRNQLIDSKGKLVTSANTLIPERTFLALSGDPIS